MFPHRRPDDVPYRCAREAMPELEYGRWRRIAAVIASRRWPARSTSTATHSTPPNPGTRSGLSQAVVALRLKQSALRG
jgi:hypothetical protein